MNREERIEKARRMAAENKPARAADAQRNAGRTAQRLANVGASAAQRHVTAAEQAGKATYLDPVSATEQWDRALELARLVTITRAKRRDTITHGEIKWVIYDELRMLIDASMFPALVQGVDHESDGVLLSAIVVGPDDGQPDDEFMPYARSMGFDDPVDVLQRQVYSQFRQHG